MELWDLLAGVLWFCAGGAIEVVNALTRKQAVERLGTQSAYVSLVWIVGGFVLRMFATGMVLVLAFRHSLVSGVLALVGYWVSRWAMIRWTERQFVS
jgi:hypothetical protein